jgi:alpha-beta hydrolase superfamily lysophospholipase
MRHLERDLPGAGGLRLFTQAWLPDADATRVVVIAHGLAEHGGRYAPLAARLVAQGCAVHAIDHRGHGRSPGRRANIGRFDDLVADLRALVESSRQEHPGLPLTLLGHSMGGALALTFALRHPELLQDLVLSAPALNAGPDVPWAQLVAVKLLSRIAPNVGALTLPAAAISRDPEVVRAYERDPLVYRGSIPARTLAELVDAMDAFPAAVGRLRCPVLILHGSGDMLALLEHCRPLYERMGSDDRTLRVYDGLYHEVFNEPERERVIGDLLEWLAARS